MIDALGLAPGKLKDAQAGSLFVAVPDARNDDHIPFLVGKVGAAPVVVSLQWDNPFQVREIGRATNRNGYSVPGFAIEVDRSHVAHRFDERDCRRGEIIRHQGGLGIIAQEGDTRHIVDLVGSPVEDVHPLVMLGFDRWEMVLRNAAERRVLYHYTGRKLLFGPFDPVTDEEE
jgi:hypothetical protein